MARILISNGTIINEEVKFKGYLAIENERIISVTKERPDGNFDNEIDASGKWVIPGLIDDQVHFREPGLTHKANIHTESAAAAAGGITSFMEMPNTVPNTLTQELLEDKYRTAAESAVVNYSFFMGASNDNLDEVLKTNKSNVCGVKVFMGSSTGNMLVDDKKTLEGLFKECEMLIATHCEDEDTVRANLAKFQSEYGEDIPIKYHPIIRSEEACYKSSSMAMELATKHNTKLHILHISTEKETHLFRNDLPLSEKRITAEACTHHLWFNDTFYDKKGTFIKWNPAVKTEQDRQGIIAAVKDNRIDVLATDHAPHTLEEKNTVYTNAPSGGPLVQHNLLALLELYKRGEFTLEQIVRKSSHSVADLFQIKDRGYLKAGYMADIVIIDPEKEITVSNDNLLYKCGWSPFEGTTFSHSISHTLVNGNIVYNDGKVDTSHRGKRLLFDR